ncbi:MAG: hypothetical protein ACYTHN_11315, partial [Planctomycetota bacterium]
PNSGGLWDSTFKSGVVGELDVGYALAPFLAVSLGVLAGEMAGEFQYQITLEDTDYTLDFDSMNFTAFYLVADLKFPLALIGPELFRFSRPSEGRGFVPFLKVGLGFCRLGSVNVERTYENVVGTPLYDSITLTESRVNFAAMVGFGMQVRWSWGGVSLEFGFHRFGKPDVQWAHGRFGGGITLAQIALGMGFYF